MLEGKVTIVNQLGLHARAAAQLVKLSACYTSCLRLRRPDTAAEADARSMLDVLTLAAPVNSVLLLSAEGEDETAAFEAVCELFASGFGEI